MTKHNKWCLECGRKVDLRQKKSIELKEEFTPNPEYRFICPRCYDGWKIQIKQLNRFGK